MRLATFVMACAILVPAFASGQEVIGVPEADFQDISRAQTAEELRALAIKYAGRTIAACNATRLAELKLKASATAWMDESMAINKLRDSLTEQASTTTVGAQQLSAGAVEVGRAGKRYYSRSVEDFTSTAVVAGVRKGLCEFNPVAAQ